METGLATPGPRNASYISFSKPLLMEGFHSKSHDSPVHSFLSTDQLSWSLCRERCRCSRSFSSQHSFSKHDFQLNIYQKVLLWFNLTLWHSSNPFLDHPWTTGSSWGTYLVLVTQCVLIVAFVTLAPALCWSFTRSPCVLLGSLLTVLVIILTPQGGDLGWSPRSSEIINCLECPHFLIFAPTVDFFTPSCWPVADSASHPGSGLPLTALWS